MRYMVMAVLMAAAMCAHAEDGSMRGLNPIVLLVEEVPEAGKGCGVTREGIRAAAEGPLSESPLKVVKFATDVKAYLYIQVNVIAVQDICMSNIYASFRTVAVVQDNQRLTIAGIWNENVIGAAWPNEAPGKIHSAVARLTKELIEEWSRDNP